MPETPLGDHSKNKFGQGLMAVPQYDDLVPNYRSQLMTANFFLSLGVANATTNVKAQALILGRNQMDRTIWILEVLKLLSRNKCRK